MCGTNYNKDRIISRLILFLIIYLSLNFLWYIPWNRIVYGLFQDRNNNIYYAVSGVFTVLSTLMIDACIIFLYWYVKKLRETEKTRKYYNMVFWIAVCEIFLSFLYYAILAAGYFLFPEAIEKYNITLYTVAAVQTTYIFIINLLPLPFFIAILVKERLDINWMIVGKLTYFYLYAIRRIIYVIRSATGYKITTFAWYNAKYPIASVFADNEFFIVMSGYFWAAGIFVLVYMYKRKNRDRIISP